MILKYSIVFIIIAVVKVFGLEVSPDTASINFLRAGFYAAIEDEDKVDLLEEYIVNKYSQDYKNYSPLILAYYGAIQTLKAKHAFNPFSKFSHLIYGLNRLEESIEESPDNLEIRFIRFSILDHLPGFLGYSKERESDKETICRLLLKKDYSSPGYDIQKGMAEYMLDSERLNEDQAKLIRNLISSFADK